MFPSMFNLVVQKDAMAADLWDCNREKGVGLQPFLGLLMIRRWRRWKAFFLPSIVKNQTLGRG